ncbi:hypothetical protein ACTI_55090 [Actinoplanes sp. OR16]|nr:hypothetical protein ACTI_55090 [Actinoplanes sp. OR16]
MDPNAPTSWHREELDFSGGTYHVVDLDGAKLHDVRVSFRDCVFSDGELRLRNVDMDDGVIDFTGSTFTNMKVLMGGMRLNGGSHIFLDLTEITDSDFYPIAVKIAGEASIKVRESQIRKSNFKFDADDIVSYMFQRKYSIISGEIDFSSSTLRDVSIPMHTYTLDAGRLVFDNAATDNFHLSAPGTMKGHVYVNIDVRSVGPTTIRIGPGEINGGDLRIRPEEGVPATLSVDFTAYKVLGGEIMVQAIQNVWKKFRFDHDGEIAGTLNFNLPFPNGVEVDIDVDQEDIYNVRRPYRRRRPSPKAISKGGPDSGDTASTATD